MLVPLYGFVEGDTMGLLVLARHDMTMCDVARLLRDSARVRVAGADDGWELHKDGQPIDATRTVAELKLEPLVRIDLRRRKS